MKRVIFLVLLLIGMIGGTVKTPAQEIISVAGGGIFRSQGLAGDYEFAEARVMFGGKNIRIGPVANVTWVYLVDNGYYYKGMNWTTGISLDNWSQGQLNRYNWLNLGYKHSYDRGATTQFMSWQRDNLMSIQAGLRLNRDIYERSWFGNNLLIVEAQFGLTPGEAILRLAGEDYKSIAPYKKGQIRISYEKGIKQIPLRQIKASEVDFEPLAHLGYGFESGNQRSYLEYGLGLGFGLFRDWYHDIFKIKAFMRHDLGTFEFKSGEANKPATLYIEVVCNLLNLSFRKAEKTETKK